MTASHTVSGDASMTPRPMKLKQIQILLVVRNFECCSFFLRVQDVDRKQRCEASSADIAGTESYLYVTEYSSRL